MLLVLLEGLLEMGMTIAGGLWPHAALEGACHFIAELTQRRPA